MRSPVLFEFLNEHKKEIIELCQQKVRAASESKPTSPLLDQGLPIFYDELTTVLRQIAVTSPGGSARDVENQISMGGAAAHGKESLRLGYSISQVVHAYGAVCQAITEYAQVKSFEITALEFHDLNFSLDLGIAEAVTEFEKTQSTMTRLKEVERLGFLIHEIGNSLVSATLAHEMIKQGHVANAGSTSKLLTDAHERMRHLLNGSMAEIRLRSHKPQKIRVRLMDIIAEVEAMTLVMENSNKVHFEIHVDPTIQFSTDRHLVFTALSNVVSNAMKFTKEDSTVRIYGKEFGSRILIEVEDECGGLPAGNPEDLFKTFVQRGTSKVGLGLGLSLSRKAIELISGKLTVRNIPGQGCIFTIDLPKN